MSTECDYLCYNSRKEHNYFSYPEWKAANMPISLKDASHALQRQIVCRLTHTHLLHHCCTRVLPNTPAGTTAKRPYGNLHRQSAVFLSLCTLQLPLAIRLWHIPFTELPEV